MGVDAPMPAAKPEETPLLTVTDDNTPITTAARQASHVAAGPQVAEHSVSASRHAADAEVDRNPSHREGAKPSARPRRRWFLLVAVFATLGGLGWIVGMRISRQDTEETHIELMGNIDVRQVNLGFKVDGRIDTLSVDEGDAVQAGDVIATLDKRYFNDELRILRARRDNLAASVAKLEHGSRPEEIAQARDQTADRAAALVKAREDYHRAEILVDKGGVSRQEFDRYQSTLNSAEAQHKAALESQRLVEIGPRQEDIDVARALLAEQDATIAQSERRLADADLVAPNDGVILTRARERGAIVLVGETIFTLTLTTPVWVRTYVTERELGLIYPEMPAMVVTDSAPERPYAGKIGFVSPTAEFTPKSVETRELRTDLVYRLRVIVDNSDRRLRQGMPVTVRLPLTEPRKKTFWQRVRAALPKELNPSNDR